MFQYCSMMVPDEIMTEARTAHNTNATKRLDRHYPDYGNHRTGSCRNYWRIGAQGAGVIESFGKDKSDKAIGYGSVAEEGTVVAKINDSLYVAAVETDKAQLEQAVANKESADSNVMQMQATLFRTTQDWNRAQKLGPSDSLSKS